MTCARGTVFVIGSLLMLITGTVHSADDKPPRADLYGDPLPAGAIARMGTVRGRLPGLVAACAFSRDGKILVAAGSDAAIRLFDAETGRPVRSCLGCGNT